MKRTLILALLCLLFVGGYAVLSLMLAETQAPPVLTEEIEGTVLALSSSSLVLETSAPGQPSAVLRRLSAEPSLCAQFSVGCTVYVTVQLHPKSGDSVLAASVLSVDETVEAERVEEAQRILEFGAAE